MSLIGLDIGSSHIKAVELEKNKDGFKLSRFALLPSNGLAEKIFSTDINDKKDSVNILKDLLKEGNFNTREVVSILPEDKIFTKIFTMPALNDKELKQAIEWEASQYLTDPISTMYLQYTILSKVEKNNDSELKEKIKEALPTIADVIENNTESKGTGNMEVLLVAAPKTLVDNNINVLTDAGLIPIALEPASIGTVGASNFQTAANNVPCIFINFGYNNLDLYFLVDNKVRFVRNVKIGVSAIVRAIAETLDMPLIQANEYLYTYGYNQSDLEGKIIEIIKPITDSLLQEISRFQNFIEKKISFNKDLEYHKIKRTIISGGGALIPNLMFYFISNLPLEVEFASPLDNINIDKITNKNSLESIGPLFVNAIGAAMR